MTGRDLKTGMEVIARDACLRLIAGQEVGRLGVVVGGKPEIFPVNYRLDGEQIVFWTGPGTKLAGLRSAPVVFEVDQLNYEARLVWSVIIHGDADRSRLAAPTPRWWVSGAWTEAIRIVPREISGRRMVTR